MAIDSGDLVGGGIFRAEVVVSNQSISASQTGDLLVIGTAGKITKITGFSCNTVGNQPDISVDIDGAIIINAKTLASTTPIQNEFFVSTTMGTSSTLLNINGNALDLIGEILTIKKGAGNTTEGLRISYVTGSIS